MNAASANPAAATYLRNMNLRLCLECGAVMNEINRINENGFEFVWYQCSRQDCTGQLLQKFPNPACKLA